MSDRVPHQIDEEDLEWEEWNPEKGTFLAHMIAGSIAGVSEHTIMYPVDTLKTHVQCDRCGKMAQPGIRSLGADGCVYAFKTLVRAEGVTRLWRGVSTMFAGCIPAHAAYFTLYEEAKRRTGADRPGHHPLAAASCGVVATLAHDSIMGPMDTVKQRLQLGFYRGMGHCVRSMLAKEGLRGFYVSLPTTLAMNLPFGAIMVTANESLKTVLQASSVVGAPGEHTIGTYLLSGSCAGAVAAAATTPLDMIKTRLQTQQLVTAASGATRAPPRPPHAFLGQQARRVVTAAVEPKAAAAAAVTAVPARGHNGGKSLSPRLLSFADAARAIYAEAGAGGFVRGMVPRILVSAPSVAVSWTAYECAKSVLRDHV